MYFLQTLPDYKIQKWMDLECSYKKIDEIDFKRKPEEFQGQKLTIKYGDNSYRWALEFSNNYTFDQGDMDWDELHVNTLYNIVGIPLTTSKEEPYTAVVITFDLEKIVDNGYGYPLAYKGS